MTIPPSAQPPVIATGAVALGKRIVGFGLIPFLSLIAPFLFLPVLARAAGADVWVAIALGQSVGGVAALVAGFGYPTLAPPMVAVASISERRRLLATSVHVRLPVWGVAVIVAVVTSAVVAPQGVGAETMGMAAAMSLAALAPTWYWIGVGKALPILWYEVLPRIAAILAAIAILLLDGSAIWYPVLLAIAMLGGPAYVYYKHAGRELAKVDTDEVRAVLRGHPPAAIAEAAAGMYNSLAVAIVTSVTPVTQAAIYISGDKAYRIGQYSVGALGNALQGWVVEARDGRFGRRLRIVITLHAGLGLSGLAVFGVLGPWLTRTLFGADLAIGGSVAFGFGVAILGIALGTAFGRIGLIVIGARKAFMSCVLVASAIGVAGLFTGGALWGAAGAAWALGITELLSGLAQGTVLALLWRRRLRTGQPLLDHGAEGGGNLKALEPSQRSEPASRDATTQTFAGRRMLIRKLRWIHVAPPLAAIALGAWAFASPIGASPDDDYHLTSTWCALGGSEACAPGTKENKRIVSTAFESARCYAMHSTESAACQEVEGLALDGPTYETKRGNFRSKYPDVYYSTMHVFAGDDLVRSALIMRLANVALFAGLATALVALLPPWRRQTLLWGWLVTLVPLGMFIISSNNPSGWATTGVGTAFLSLLGWFETTGKRRWCLGTLYVVGVVMAAGSRSDAGIYAAGATVVVMILTASRTREWLRRAILPFAGLVVVATLFATVTQSTIGLDGFTDAPVVAASPAATYAPASAAAAVPEAPAPATKPATDDPGAPDNKATAPSGGVKLAAYNLLMLPYLWTGVWGTWALGWFDTELPPIVPWTAAGAFIAVAIAGLASLSKRKAFAVVGVLTVLVVLPVYLLTAGGDAVGSQFQPRYLLPLIVLLSLLLATAPPGRRPVRFTWLQTLVLMAALATANLVALATNIRRYVSGADELSLNLNSGVEWWWHGAILGPMSLWLVGSGAFVLLLAALWPELRRKGVTAP